MSTETQGQTEAPETELPATGIEQNPEILAGGAFDKVQALQQYGLPTISREEFIARITPGIAQIIKEKEKFSPETFATQVGEYEAIRRHHEEAVERVFEQCGKIDEEGDQVLNFRELNPANFEIVMARTLAVSAASIGIHRLCRVDGRDLGLISVSKIFVVEDPRGLHSDKLCDLLISRKTGSHTEINLNEGTFIDKADLPPANILTLAKIGREAGPEYAQLVSKAIHKARYGTRPGQEKKSNQLKRRSELSDHVQRYIHDPLTPLSYKINAATLNEGLLGPPRPAAELRGAAIDPFKTLGSSDMRPQIKAKAETIYSAMLVLLSRQEEPKATLALAKEVLLSFELTAADIVGKTSPTKDPNKVSYKVAEIKIDLRNEFFTLVKTGIGEDFYDDLVSKFKEFQNEPKNASDLAEIEKIPHHLVGHLTIRGINSLSAANVEIYESSSIRLFSVRELCKSSGKRSSPVFSHTRTIIEIKDSIKKTPSLAELVYVYNLLSTQRVILNKVINPLAQKLRQLPNYLGDLLKSLNLSASKADERAAYGDTDLELFEKVFEGEVAESEAYSQLIDALIAPHYQTYYNAVAVVRHLIGLPQYQDHCLKALGAKLFSEASHWTDPVRLAVYRDLVEGASQQTMQALFESIMPRQESGIYPSNEIMEFHFGLIAQAATDSPATKKNDSKSQEEKPNPYKAIEVLKTFPSLTLTSTRDLATQAQHIVDERTIQIADTGNQVTLEGSVDSPLATIFPKAIVKRNKSALKQSKSLACNVTLDTKDNTRLYCRLNHGGELTIRILEEGTEKAKIEKGNAEENGINPKVFEELNFLILSALEIIYLKTEHPKKVEEQPKAPNDPVPKGGFSTTEDPITVKRREPGQMKIDLTTHEKNRTAKDEDKERAQIAANTSAVAKLFAPLSRGEKLDTEDIPEAAEELILYKKIPLKSAYGKDLKGKDSVTYQRLDGVDAYVNLAMGTMNPNNIYIRKVRAHSTPLPYLLRSPAGDTRLYTTFQAQPSEHAKQRHEIFIVDGNERLNDRTFNGILTYEVDETPENQRLLLQIQEPTTMRRLTEARIHEAQRAESEAISDLHEQQKQANDPAEKLRITAQIQDIKTSTRAQIAEIQKTMQTPDDIWTQRLQAQTELLQEETGAQLTALEVEKDRKTTRRTKEEVASKMKNLIDNARARVQELEALINKLPKTSELTGLARTKTYNTGEGQETTTIELPQHGFPFHQTFNHGQFVSLAEVL